MKKDPVSTGWAILDAFGGKENVVSVTHCATRLRVGLKDASLVDEQAMKEIPGAAGYFCKSGQHQVILGTGFVNKVCAEVQKMTGLTDGAHVAQEGHQKISFQSVTKMISDIFIPIIPVLLATGILMGLRSLLISGFGISFSKEFDTVYTVLTDTAYTFIPVLVAWSACKKFGGSPIMGIVLGLMLVSPYLPNKWDVVNGLAEPLKFVLGPLTLNVNGYQSSVIPALFGISEPVMYGLTFPRIKPFFMGCLGGAVGGGFAAIVGLCAKGTGASMFPGMLLYLQGGMIPYIVVLALSIGVGFAGTWLVMRREMKEENAAAETAAN